MFVRTRSANRESHVDSGSHESRTLIGTSVAGVAGIGEEVLVSLGGGTRTVFPGVGVDEGEDSDSGVRSEYAYGGGKGSIGIVPTFVSCSLTIPIIRTE